MNGQFDAELNAALLGFNGEAVPYCQGISDKVAQEYAMNYARMLQNRAKGIESSLPRIPYGLFEQFSPARTRDVDHRGSMSPQLGSPSECNAVVLEALPSVNSDPGFQALGLVGLDQLLQSPLPVLNMFFHAIDNFHNLFVSAADLISNVLLQVVELIDSFLRESPNTFTGLSTGFRRKHERDERA